MSFLEPNGRGDFAAIQTAGSKIPRIRIKPSRRHLKPSSIQFPGQYGRVHEIHCSWECFWMQIFWNAGTDVFDETWPLIVRCDLLLIDRNQRLEDSSIDCIVDQEYAAFGLQPSVELSQARSNAIAIEKVK